MSATLMVDPPQACVQAPTENDTGWLANLYLCFAASPRRTILKRRRHHGPLHVQRPFYPEDNGTCHVYLLHPPGGVVPGDQLDIEVDVETDAKTLVTTPAAGKFYRSHGPTSRVTANLHVRENGYLEWLPQETIVFPGCRAEITTRVNLDNQSSGFAGWEIMCLGRPASKNYFTTGCSKQSFEIWRNGTPILIDRNTFDGGSPVLSEAWGLGGRTVTGIFACVTSEDLVDEVRSILPAPTEETLVAISHLEGVLVARYLGHHAEEARTYFTKIWEVVRPRLSQRKICEPRIWNT